MIGRMEAHEIDAPSVAIVGVEFGRVAVGQRAELEKFGRAGARAERLERVRRPSGALALDRLLQRRVGIVEVIVGEFDRLVEDLMGRGAVRVEGGAEIVLSILAERPWRAIPFFPEVPPAQGMSKESPALAVAVRARAC